MKKALLFTILLGVALTACDKVNDKPAQTDDSMAMLKSLTLPEINCDWTFYNLLAGTLEFHASAGNFWISNDDTNLYMLFWAHNGFQAVSDNIDIAFYNTLPATRPDVNGFHYHYTVPEGEQSYLITIPLASVFVEDLGTTAAVACYQNINILTHVDIMLDPDLSDMNYTATPESGWVGELGPDGQWWKWFSYAPCCYVMECDEETAWSNGRRYVAKGDWAMYSGYSGIAKTEILYAGQYMEAGMVYFTPAGSDVNINIILNEGWSLQDVSEPVKIQGYNVAPTVKPSPGLFNTYKGEDLMVTVAAFNYYGVHVDLQYCGR